MLTANVNEEQKTHQQFSFFTLSRSDALARARTSLRVNFMLMNVEISIGNASISSSNAFSEHRPSAAVRQSLRTRLAASPWQQRVTTSARCTASEAEGDKTPNFFFYYAITFIFIQTYTSLNSNRKSWVYEEKKKNKHVHEGKINN